MALTGFPYANPWTDAQPLFCSTHPHPSPTHTQGPLDTRCYEGMADRAQGYHIGYIATIDSRDNLASYAQSGLHLAIVRETIKPGPSQWKRTLGNTLHTLEDTDGISARGGCAAVCDG